MRTRNRKFQTERPDHVLYLTVRSARNTPTVICERTLTYMDRRAGLKPWAGLGMGKGSYSRNKVPLEDYYRVILVVCDKLLLPLIYEVTFVLVVGNVQNFWCEQKFVTHHQNHP